MDLVSGISVDWVGGVLPGVSDGSWADRRELGTNHHTTSPAAISPAADCLADTGTLHRFTAARSGWGDDDGTASWAALLPSVDTRVPHLLQNFAAPVIASPHAMQYMILPPSHTRTAAIPRARSYSRRARFCFDFSNPRAAALRYQSIAAGISLAVGDGGGGKGDGRPARSSKTAIARSSIEQRIGRIAGNGRCGGRGRAGRAIDSSTLTGNESKRRHSERHDCCERHHGQHGLSVSMTLLRGRLRYRLIAVDGRLRQRNTSGHRITARPTEPGFFRQIRTASGAQHEPSPRSGATMPVSSNGLSAWPIHFGVRE